MTTSASGSQAHPRRALASAIVNHLLADMIRGHLLYGTHNLLGAVGQSVPQQPFGAKRIIHFVDLLRLRDKASSLLRRGEVDRIHAQFRV